MEHKASKCIKCGLYTNIPDITTEKCFEGVHDFALPHKDDTNLKYCATCIQMTNHNGATCLKCGLACKDDVEWWIPALDSVIKDIEKWFDCPLSWNQEKVLKNFAKTLLAHKEESLRGKIEEIARGVSPTFTGSMGSGALWALEQVLALLSDK